MKKCPKCKHSKLIKNGFVKGKQRYRCKKCLYNPSVEHKANSLPIEIKRFALELYLEGLGFNSIGRLLGVSHVSVIKWIKLFGTIAHQWRQTRPAATVELDEMHSYIGQKKTMHGCGLLWIEEKNSSWTSKLVIGVKKQEHFFGKKLNQKQKEQDL